MRLGFHGHETFSSKVREMVSSSYLPLQANSFPGWPQGVLRHTRRGCERGNMQGEQGRESRNPGIGMQEMCARVGRKGCAMSAALWNHTVKPALWVPVLRSSYDFSLEESLNSSFYDGNTVILLLPGNGGKYRYMCVRSFYVYVYIYMYTHTHAHTLFLKDSCMETYCDPLISLWCSVTTERSSLRAWID